MDESNMSHYKDFLHEIKYVKPDRNLNRPLELSGYSDGDYEGDKYTQKSVTGYIVLINGALISCRLQCQKTGTLYVT